jgi:hypothetical protein
MRGSGTFSNSLTITRGVTGAVVGSNCHWDSRPHRGTTVTKRTRDGGVGAGRDLHPVQNHTITLRVDRPSAASGAVSYQFAQLTPGSVGAVECVADFFCGTVIREQGAYPSEVRLIASSVALPRVLKRSGALLLRSGVPLMVLAGAKKSS